MRVPLISILMAVYNEEQSILKSIKSIQNQTFKNWELIIIDDGSKDKTFELISKLIFKNSKIKLIKNSKNLGLSESLNKGIKLARAKYIARADADDINLPDRLKKQYKFLLENKKIDALGTGAWLIDKNGKRHKSAFFNKKFSIHDRKIFSKPIFFHPSVMFRKRFFRKVGVYDPNFLRAQDKELWLRGLKKGAIYSNLSEALIEYNTRNYVRSWKDIFLTTTSLTRLQKIYKFRFGHIFIVKFILFSILTNLKIYKPLTRSFF